MADTQLQTGAQEQQLPVEIADYAIERVKQAFGNAVHCTITKTVHGYATVCIWPRLATDSIERAVNTEETRAAGWYLAGFYHGHIYTVE